LLPLSQIQASNGKEGHFDKKVLLTLSSAVKLRNFDIGMKMIAMAPLQWFVQPFMAFTYPLVWAVVLSVSKVMRRPECGIGQ
jgi:hypothetical protein